MPESSYSNSTQAFLSELRAVMSEGQDILVRGLKTRELRARLVQLARPQDRVLLVPHRNNSIFASLAETLWVLAGKNDLEFLSSYLPRAHDFSDNGQEWRAGYGPRLRAWHGVDQLRNAVEKLRIDPNSRRAVMILFDPAQDNVESKDVPCNNWIHTLIRQNQLHISLAVRSNDLVWGFSGINTFEWSILQELIALWTGVSIGSATYFIDSLHIYERHFDRAERMLTDSREKTLYDFGFESPRLSTAFEEFDEVLARWFSIEKQIRDSKQIHAKDWEQFSDSLFRNAIQLVGVYNRFVDGADRHELVDLLAALPESDLKLAAIEFLARAFQSRDFIPLSAREAEYLEYLWNGTVRPSGRSLENIFRLLSELHRRKTLVYGDSWKKHGEVLGIFANITRKYDRIEVAVNQPPIMSNDEPIIDTVADIAVYCMKYLTFLAERDQMHFGEFVTESNMHESVDVYQGNEGFDSVARLLAERALRTSDNSGARNIGELAQRIRPYYEVLERQLIGPAHEENPREKILAAASLALEAVRFLLTCAQQNTIGFQTFERNVEG